MSRSLFDFQLSRIVRAIGAERRGGPAAFDALRRSAACAPGATTRRQLLAGFGALGVASCLPKAYPGEPRIAIIGAGIAGMACLHRLNKAGVRATVYEATDRAGGRMYSKTGLFEGGEGVVTELGGEWIDSIHTEIQELAAELGIDLVDTLDDSLDEVYWFLGESHDYLSVVGAMAPLLASIEDALGSIDGGMDAVSYKNPAGASRLDSMSVPEWLESVDANELATALARMASTSSYGLDPEEQSALNVMLYFHESLQGADQRYKVVGGDMQIPAKLAAIYADRVRYGMALTSLSGDGPYTLGFADGSEVTADYVVLAVPFTVLRQLEVTTALPAVKRLAIDTLGYGSNAKIVVPFDRPFWRDLRSGGYAYSDLEFGTAWDGALKQDTTLGVLINFLGGSRGRTLNPDDPTGEAARFVRDLSSFWSDAPDLQRPGSVIQHWPTVPTVQGSYAAYKVGQYTSIGGAEAEPVGNLFFAGEHTSTDFQGYMNGGAETGRRAAEEIIETLLGGAARRRKALAGRRRRVR